MKKKHMKKKITKQVTSGLMALTLAVGSSFAVAPQPVYAALSEAQEAELQAAILEWMLSCDIDATLDVSSYRLSYVEISILVDSILKEAQAESLAFNWFYGNGSISVGYEKTTTTVTTLYWSGSDENFQTRYEQTMKVKSNILAGIDSDMTDLDKIIYLNEWFVDNTAYSESTYEGLAHNNLGRLLVYGSGSVTAYSKAMHLLLDELEIENKLTSGLYGYISRTWNLVKCDGEWYHVDVAWNEDEDRQREYGPHSNLMMNDTRANLMGHRSWQIYENSVLVEVPACTSTKFDDWFALSVYDTMKYYDGYWYYANGTNIYKAKADGSVNTLVWETEGTVDLTVLTDGVLIFTSDGATVALDLDTLNVIEDLDNLGWTLTNMLLADSSKWRSGNYSATDGTYAEYTGRACLQSKVIINEGEYTIHLTDEDYRLLIREYDATGRMTGSYELKNGDTYETSDATTISISLYNPNDSSITLEQYQSLLSGGLLSFKLATVSLSVVNEANFDNWRSGWYSTADGAYEEDSEKACLKKYVEIPEGQYNISLTNKNYQVLINEYDENGRMIDSNTFVNGSVYTTNSNADMIGISVYAPGLWGTSATTYKKLIESGFLSIKSTTQTEEPKTVALQSGLTVTLKSNALTYGEALSELEFNSATFVEEGTDTVVEGMLAWKDETKIPSVGTTQATWVFTPSDDSYAAIEGTVGITVAQAEPNVSSMPSVADRTYNATQALTNEDLTGGSVAGVDGTALAGTWSWQNTDVIPVVNNSGYTAVFTPTDSTNYRTITRTVAVNVAKASETPDMPDSTMSVANACEKVSDVELPGDWNWQESDQDKTLEPGAAITATAVYNGTDKGNYTKESVTVTITRRTKAQEEKTIVLQSGSSVTLKNSALTYGEALSELEFNSATFVEEGTDTVVEGTLAWKDETKTPSVGTTQATWVFTPSDDSYSVLEGTVTVTVTQAEPTILVMPTVTDRIYNAERTLVNEDLTGGSVTGVDGTALAGTWSWQTSGVIPVVNNSGYTAVFTPTDSTNYRTITRTVAVNVAKASETPDMPDSTMSVANACEKVSDVELPGDWNWQESDQDKTLEPGAAITATAVYNGSDKGNYTKESVTVTITRRTKAQEEKTIVLQSGSSVTLKNSALTYGEALSELEFHSATFVEEGTDTVVEGTLAWKDETKTPSVGTTQATWVFTPSDDRYSVLEGTVTVTVTQAEPTVLVMPTVTDRIYNAERTLVNEDLTGGSVAGVDGTALAGTWSWQNTDVIPVVNNSGYTAVFTPTDSTNYRTITRTVAVNVAKASETPDMPDSTMSVANACEKVSDVELPGDWNWQESDQDKTLEPGAAITATAVYNGSDKGNYTKESVTVTITRRTKAQEEKTIVLQSGSSVTLKNSALTYGEALSELEFNSATFVEEGTDTVVEGTLAWKDETKTPSVGTTQATWVFTPSDDSYAAIEGTVGITVAQAEPNVSSMPSVADRTYNATQALTNEDLTGGSVTGVDGTALAGTWSWQTSGVIPVVNNSGYTAVFTPLDTTNYKSVTRTITVNVVKSADTPNMPDSIMGVANACEKVSDVGLSEDWVWQESDQDKSLEPGVAVNATAVYNGSDKGNYANETIVITITREAKSEESGGTEEPGNPEIPKDPIYVNPFKDVADSAWYAKSVQYVVEKGLFTGTAEDTFTPNGQMTRGMLVAVLYRAAGRPEVTGGKTYPDVKSNAYYASAVAWASSIGMATGYSDGKFHPNDPVTREQVAKILYHYAKDSGQDVTAKTDISGYRDYYKISGYAVKYMEWAAAEGVITGSSNKLNPKGNATRAEVASMLRRFIEK